MSKYTTREEALRLIALEDATNHDMRVARKMRELEELKEYEDNKKLQNSGCPHTDKERWKHGREEECRQCGARWSH